MTRPDAASADHETVVGRPSAMGDLPRRPTRGLALALGCGYELASVPPIVGLLVHDAATDGRPSGDSSTVGFTAFVGARERGAGSGRPRRWSGGARPPATRVYFDVDSFNVQNGVMNTCGIEPLPVGAE